MVPLIGEPGTPPTKRVWIDPVPHKKTVIGRFFLTLNPIPKNECGLSESVVFQTQVNKDRLFRVTAFSTFFKLGL